MQYKVIVGNIGTVCRTNSRMAAVERYGDYVLQSTIGYGRAAGEPVTLMRDGEPIKEHFGDPGEGKSEG
jgi:hypothetical protein